MKPNWKAVSGLTMTRNMCPIPDSGAQDSTEYCSYLQELAVQGFLSSQVLNILRNS